MQRTLCTVRRHAPNLFRLRNQPQSCVRELKLSAALAMPRLGGGSGGRGEKIKLSCPKCQTLIMFYCKFSGTKRHIRCHKCDSLVTVLHTHKHDHHIPESLLEDLVRGDIKSMDDKRLGRLFAPPYEEPCDSEDGPERPTLGKAPPPREIVAYLDRFVQGQDKAKRVLSVAVYNHYKRLHALNSETPDENAPRLDKSNILVIGPTGSGKTYMFQMAAKLLDVPMVVCDCTSLTQAGYVGEDVDSVIMRLWQAAGQNLERTQQGIIVLDELDKLASKRNKHGGKDIGGEGVQQSLLKIIEGTKVTVNDKAKNKSHQIDTRNILFLASGAFIGLDQIVKRRTASKSLGFGTPAMVPATPPPKRPLSTSLGETLESEERTERLTKIRETEEKNRARDQLLEQVEPKDVLDYGMIPELAGRIPILTTLNSLTKQDLIVIAKDKERGVISQLTELLSLNNCHLEFTEDALASIAELAFCKKTGARALKSIVETTLLETMFEVPGSDITHARITSATVLDGATPVYTRAEQKKNEV